MTIGQKVCNICGEPLGFTEQTCGNFSAQYRIGYGSKHDGEVFYINFCNECLDKFIDICAVSPIVDRVIL